MIGGLSMLGCGSGEAADTSPLPAKDTQARVDDASKKIEASSMTPEQKQAAAAYLHQGAANAEQMKKMAGAPK
ncbi:hypothetical protein EON82_00740 [bacterium]|nr:MAG: hypothetical protein EON82_00740 [bacterium]